MKIALLKIGNMLLSALYAFMKFLHRDKNKIVFLSRQTNEPSLDFIMLRDEILRQRSDAHLVFICNRIAAGLRSKISFAYDMLRSMYHLATSSVCVLDSYWPAVSILNHGSDLTVIQIWHALGKIKQSGLQSVGRPDGRSKEIARVMHMHRNYDFIVAGAPIWNDCYCACFGCKETQLFNVGLPRLDVLTSSMEAWADAIAARYPQLKDKPVVLYAPTFRRTKHKEHADLILALLGEDCELVIKPHPNQQIDTHGALECPEFSGMELLSVANLVITDYSAIALEAAAAGIPTLYYLYDYDDYRECNGINLDIPAEMPGCVFYDVSSLVRGVHEALEGRYPKDALDSYRRKFLISNLGHSTQDIAALILACAKGGKTAGTKFVREMGCA